MDGAWLAYIGLGSNVAWQDTAGHVHAPVQMLRLAVDALGGLGRVRAVSGVWRTEPVGPVRDQPAFLNAVAALVTDLAPEALLRELLAVELHHGRERGAVAKGPRTLDLDLLLMGPAGTGEGEAPPPQEERRSAALTLPHPELHRRRFVLAPLAEIAPRLRLPGLGSTVGELLDGLPEEGAAERIGPLNKEPADTASSAGSRNEEQNGIPDGTPAGAAASGQRYSVRGEGARPGRLEVITGPMFSGKTEELIRRLRRAEIARLRTVCFKPALDTRFEGELVASHSRQARSAVAVEGVAAMRAWLATARDGAVVEVVGIDEAQFLEPSLVELVGELVRAGRRVIAAGLDMTFAGVPFGSMPALLALADDVVKLSAVCMVCGAPAAHSQRLGGSRGTVEVGAAESYEARCRLHFDP